MIYIIGGAMRCGKTITARRLHEKYNLPVIYTDVVRNDLRAVSSIEKDPVLFGWEAENSLAPTEWEKRHQYEAGQLAQKLRGEAYHLWPSVLHKIETTRGDYIVEGAHLLPDMLTQLSEPFTAVFVIDSSLDQYLRICAHNPGGDEPKYVKAWAHFNVAYGTYVTSECKRLGYTCLDIAEIGFEDAMKKLELKLNI